MPKVLVRFKAIYETHVNVNQETSLQDAVSDIDIPENDDCKYVDDSFEVVNDISEFIHTKCGLLPLLEVDKHAEQCPVCRKDLISRGLVDPGSDE